MSHTATNSTRKSKRTRPIKRMKSSRSTIHVQIHSIYTDQRKNHKSASLAKRDIGLSARLPSTPCKNPILSCQISSKHSKVSAVEQNDQSSSTVEKRKESPSPVWFDTNNCRSHSDKSELILLGVDAFDNPNNHHRSKEENRKKKKKKCFNLKCCILITLLCLAFVGAVTTGLCVGLLLKPNTKVSSSSSLSSSSIMNNTMSTITLLTNVSTTATVTTTVMTTTAAAINVSCSPVCNSSLICIQAVCVGTGYLSFTITWSRPGDGDIVVTTPNSNTIWYNNIGPSSSTDQGVLDVDDTAGTGPENVVWPNSVTSSAPPNGNYDVCFEPYNFVPAISVSDPLTVSLRIYRGLTLMITAQLTFTYPVTDGYKCSSSSSTLLASHTYP